MSKIFVFFIAAVFFISCGSQKSNSQKIPNTKKKDDIAGEFNQITRDSDAEQASFSPESVSSDGYNHPSGVASRQNKAMSQPQSQAINQSQSKAKKGLVITGNVMQNIGGLVNQHSNGNKGASIAGGVIDAFGGFLGDIAQFIPGDGGTPSYAPSTNKPVIQKSSAEEEIPVGEIPMTDDEGLLDSVIILND